jgi:DNA-binding beta-propeller fold protein YncE
MAYSYLWRVLAAASAGAVLSAIGVTGAVAAPRGGPGSARAGAGARAARGAQQWVARLGSASATDHDAEAVSPDGKTVFVSGETTKTSPGGNTTVAYNATTGATRWSKHTTAINNAGEDVFVAVSPTGKTIFVTGTRVDSKSNFDFATVAYNAVTGAQLWVKDFNGPAKPSDDSATGIAVSPGGSTVFVTGYSNGKGTSGFDYATVAYNAKSGAQVWAKRYAGPGTGANGGDSPSAVAVGSTGKTVFVTGISAHADAFGDYATVAYDATTGATRWVKRYHILVGGSGASGLTVSPDAKTVFVTGESNGNYATLAYNAATGGQEWVKRYVGVAGTSAATAIAVNSAGTLVFVTGDSSAPDGLSTPQYATVAYHAKTGAQAWVKRYTGLKGSTGNIPFSIAVNPVRGTVYVTGESTGSTLGYDYATVAYDAATGAQQWLARYNGPVKEFDEAFQVVVNPTGKAVYVTGYSEGASSLKTSYATAAYSG